MVGGALLVERVAVSEVDEVGRPVVEDAARLVLRGTVGELVGEHERLCALAVEEPLVIEVAAEGGSSELHVHIGAILIAAAVVAAPHDRCVGHIVARLEAGDAGGGIDGAHGVEVIPQAHIAHGERQFYRGAGRTQDGALAILLLTLHGGGARAGVVDHRIGTVGEAALLSAHKGAAAHGAVARRSPKGAVVAVERLHGLRVLPVEHDVEHTAGPFGIELSPRIGEYLDVFHRCGRHALEYHGRIAREHGVGFPVDINLEG